MPARRGPKLIDMPRRGNRERCTWTRSVATACSPSRVPAHGAGVLRPAAAGRYRHVEQGRRGDADQAIQLAQLGAEEALEIAHALRRVVVAKPPKPVRPFAHGEL